MHEPRHGFPAGMHKLSLHHEKLHVSSCDLQLDNSSLHDRVRSRNAAIFNFPFDPGPNERFDFYFYQKTTVMTR